MKRRARRWLTALWPAFFCACALELGVFAFVDPRALHDLQGVPLVGAEGGAELSAVTVQSLAFLFFWAAVSAAIATSRWLDAGVHATPPPRP